MNEKERHEKVRIMEEGEYLLRRSSGDGDFLVTLRAGEFYVSGKRRILCSCTGKTLKTATPLETVEGVGAVCPKCGKTLEIVKTPEDFRAAREARARKDREELHLTPAGMTEDFGRAYRLSTRIERSDWSKIARYMMYVRRGDEMGMDADDYDLGWVTFSPAKVEEALGITGEWTLAAQEEATKKRQEEAEQKRQEIVADGKTLCKKHADRAFFADWSWDDYGQAVGPVVDESDRWEVREYLIDGEVVGLTLKAKTGNAVSPAEVITGQWGYSQNSVLARMAKGGKHE